MRAPPPPAGTSIAPAESEEEPVFLEDPGFAWRFPAGWRLPLDLDRWVGWIAAAMVAAAALQTAAELVSGALQGWAPGAAQLPFPSPSGYCSLLLLGAMLVLALRRATVGMSAEWLRGVCCAAAATGAGLVVSQLVGGVQGIVLAHPDAGVLEPSSVAGARVAAAGSLGDALPAAAALALAVLLHRWTAATPPGPAGPRRAGMGRPVASALAGAAAASACLLWFESGVQQVGQLSSPFDSQSISGSTAPPPVLPVAPTGADCLSTPYSGVAYCSTPTPTVTCPDTIEGAVCRATGGGVVEGGRVVGGSVSAVSSPPTGCKVSDPEDVICAPWPVRSP
jgi:hypothetical protein